MLFACMWLLMLVFSLNHLSECECLYRFHEREQDGELMFREKRLSGGGWREGGREGRVW